MTVVQIGTDKHALPLVQQAGMQIQSTLRQLQYVIGRAPAQGQNPVTERSLKPKLDVITLLSRRVHGHARTPRQRHRCDGLAGLPMETVRARAVEHVLVLVDQHRLTGSPVVAGIVHATQQLHRAVLSAEEGVAIAGVIGDPVDTGAVQAGLVPFAFVYVYVAEFAFKALVAIAGVIADAVAACA